MRFQLFHSRFELRNSYLVELNYLYITDIINYI